MTKRLLFLAFLLANAFLSFSQVNRGAVATQFVGSGTETDPYLISDASELRLLSDKVEAGTTYRGAFFKMTSDIIINKEVLTDDHELNTQNYSNFEEWKPIGKGRYPFCGTFDGNGYSISGLFIDDIEKEHVALFEYFDGKIQNLTIKDSYLCGKNAAGFVGYNGSTDPIIENCHAFVRVVAEECGAGFSVGNKSDKNVQSIVCKECSNHYKIEACIAAGISLCNYTWCYNCVNYGEIISISSSGWANGLANGTNIRIYNSINKGSVKAEGDAYGICGVFYGAALNQIINIGRIEGPKDCTYALIGGSRNNNAKLSYGYYLEFCADKMYRFYSKDIHAYERTEPYMKSGEFLKTLNDTRSKLTYADYKLSSWIKDEDGFPTLDFMKPLIASLDNAKTEVEKEPVILQMNNNIIVQNVSTKQVVTIYNLMGQKVFQSLPDYNGNVSLQVPYKSGEVIVVNIGASCSKKLLLK